MPSWATLLSLLHCRATQCARQHQRSTPDTHFHAGAESFFCGAFLADTSKRQMPSSPTPSAWQLVNAVLSDKMDTITCVNNTGAIKAAGLAYQDRTKDAHGNQRFGEKRTLVISMSVPRDISYSSSSARITILPPTSATNPLSDRP